MVRIATQPCGLRLKESHTGAAGVAHNMLYQNETSCKARPT